MPARRCGKSAWAFSNDHETPSTCSGVHSGRTPRTVMNAVCPSKVSLRTVASSDTHPAAGVVDVTRRWADRGVVAARWWLSRPVAGAASWWPVAEPTRERCTVPTAERRSDRACTWEVRLVATAAGRCSGDGVARAFPATPTMPTAATAAPAITAGADAYRRPPPPVGVGRTTLVMPSPP